MVEIFKRLKPMKCRDAERALRGLGFEQKPGKATSHRQWVKVVNGHKYKVTLDCHKGEVSGKNVRSMIAQAGVSRSDFYAAAGLIKGAAGTGSAAGETE